MICIVCESTIGQDPDCKDFLKSLVKENERDAETKEGADDEINLIEKLNKKSL